MKKLLLAVLLLPCAVSATPFIDLSAMPANYFRFNNPLSHPVTMAGALVANNGKDSEGVVMFPILTHSPNDGCLLPSVVCEDWSPVAVGASMNAGKVSFEVAPIFNVLPWMQKGILAILPGSWDSTRSIFTPAPGSQPVTFSAGPAWEYQQITNKGYYKTFTGLALHY